MLAFLTLAVCCIVIGLLLFVFWGNLKTFARSLYLVMAGFWLIVGVTAQFYWEDLRPLMNIPVDRTVAGVVFFILFSFNFIRWRMQRAAQRHDSEEHSPRRSRVVHREYDPTFDFSDTKPNDAKPPNGFKEGPPPV